MLSWGMGQMENLLPEESTLARKPWDPLSGGEAVRKTGIPKTL